MHLQLRLAQPDLLMAQSSFPSSFILRPSPLPYRLEQNMDIVSSASAVVGLVFNFATAAKTCKDVRGRYKAAALTIDSIKQELETLQGALQQLANLMMHDASALTSQWDTDQSLSGTFTRSMKGFERTIRGLQAELDKLKLEKEVLGRLDKAKVVWNEDGMREHLSRLRSQAGALQLLLHVLQVWVFLLCSVKQQKLTFSSGAVSEVKQHVKNLEAALGRAAVTSTGDNLGESEDPIANRPTFLGDQEDLLDLAWSEKETEIPSSVQRNQSVHLDLLREEFSTDLDDALDTGTSSSIVSSTSEARNGDPFEESISPALQSPNEKEKAEDTIASSSSKAELMAPNPNPGQTSMQLIQAVIRADLRQVTDLLDHGYDIETQEPENNRTGLMFAALLNYSEILQLLLDRGANIAVRDKSGRTALHFAASEGSCK
jgi:hypothetical protein